MALALRLAELGAYTTKPNPMVGCVIAHGAEVVGTGFHVRKGESHAEVHALLGAGERAKGATVYVHPKGLPHLAAPEKLYNSARMIYGDDMERLWGPMHPIPESRLYAPEHGEVIEAAGLRFTAWYTPGHAVHHIAWEASLSEGEAALFAGDVAGVRIGSGPVVPPCPPPDIHVEDWQASIQLMRDLPVEHIYLTHFGLVANKQQHLNDLEARLLVSAEWMRPYAEANTPVEEVVPKFKAFALAELAAAGVDEEGLQRYDLANPAFMSVAGLMRYWKKVRGV